jgi:ABC-type Na+ efflux pump permease subunit
MDIQNVRSVVAKDFETIKRRRSIIIGIVVLPLLLSVVFSSIVQNQLSQGVQNGVAPSQIALGLEGLTYFFVVLAAILPGSIAAYSIVGEKIEKSLEPLLATPMTDGEILLGKCIAAFVPPILATWSGAAIFMAVSDYILYSGLSALYFPEWISGIMMLLLAPLAGIFSVEVTVIVSSRVNDVRGATQISSLMFIPFMIVFLEAVAGSFTFNVSNVLALSGILLAVDVGLFFLSTSIFKREEILTKWK